MAMQTSQGARPVRYYWLLPAAFLAAIAAVMMHAAAAQSPYDCDNWTAWIDRMPGPGAVPTLHVQGSCAFRFAGDGVGLKPHLPPGNDSGVLLMDLVVHAPAGPQAPGSGGASISYSSSVASKYRTVVILPDRITVPIRPTF
jgi:hypothetical protein